MIKYFILVTNILDCVNMLRKYVYKLFEYVAVKNHRKEFLKNSLIPLHILSQYSSSQFCFLTKHFSVWIKS